MHQLLIAFSFVAVISLPDMIARSQKEELASEKNLPFGFLSGLVAWVQAKFKYFHPVHRVSPPASLHSLPLDEHKA